MKFSNKILTLMLSVAVILTCFTFPHVSAKESDIHVDKSVQLLDALKIASFPMESAGQQITRREFVKAVCMMGTYGTGDGKWTGQQLFSDVPLNDPDVGYFFTAKQMNLISGFSDGTFRPNDPLSVAEAATILIRLLGYGHKAEALGGYPTGYFSVANEISLFKNIEFSYDNMLTIGEGAVLFSNALHTDLMTPSLIEGDSQIYTVQKGVTLLSRNFKVFYTDGIVEGVDITNLRGDNVTPPRHMLVGDTDIFSGKMEVYGYLGYQVTAYYREAAPGDTKELVFIWMDERKNKETLLSIRDIDAIESYQVTYTNVAGRSVRVSYEPFAAILYNGVTTTYPFNMELIENKNGTLKLLDNNNDGKADALFADAYETIVVGKTDTSTSTVYDYYDNTRRITLDLTEDDPYVLLFNEQGEQASFGKISEMSVLTVYHSLPDAPQQFINAWISNQKVTGKLEAIETDGKHSFAVVNSVHIELSKHKNTGGNLTLGSFIEIGLDKEGKGAYVKALDGGTEQFAYLMGLQKTQGLDGVVTAKIMNIKGDFMVYPLSTRLMIDEVVYKDFPDTLFQVLNRSSQAVTPGTAQDCVAQAVRFTMNGKGEIDYIDTVFHDPSGELGSPSNISGKNKLFMIPYDKLNFKQSARSLGGKILIPKMANVLRLPMPNDSTVDYMNEELYEVTNGSYFADNNNYTGVAYYSRNDIAGAELITIKNDGKGGWGSSEIPFSYFIKAVKAIDNDGSVLTKIYFNQYGKERTLFCKEDISFTASNGMKYRPEDLICGDMFRYIDGMSGYVTAFNLIYRAENDTIYTAFGTGVYDAPRLVKGYLYGAYEDGFQFKVTDDPAALANMEDMEVARTGSYPIMVYDTSARSATGKLKVGSVDDLIGYNRAGTDCSRIVIQQRYCEPISLYIVK